jgi:hypothetical protein
VTGAHFIYIPMVLLVGIVVGFILGGRAARDAAAMDKTKAERRAAARAARAGRTGDRPPPEGPRPPAEP